MSDCRVIDILTALENQAGSTAARDVAREHASWQNDATATGTNAITERSFYYAKRKARVMAIYFIATTAVTAAATDYFTLTVRKRPASAPGTPVDLATYAADTTTTDDAAAFTPKSIGPGSSYGSATGSDFNLAAGDVLSAIVAKAGTGMTFPVSCVSVLVEPRD